MERKMSHEGLSDLIDGGQFLAAEELFSERRTDDPFEMVIRAKVAMSFGRLEDADIRAAQVAPRISDINVAARFSLTRGRLALVQDRDDQAQAPLESAFHFYSFHNDAFGIARALLALATLSRRRGNLDEAATQLENAEELISGRTTKRSDYLKFIITTERAHLAVDRGETDLAAELYSEATPGLRQLEKGKFYAYSLLGQADLRCELGEYQESLEIYKEANTVFERYDLKRDSADCQLK